MQLWTTLEEDERVQQWDQEEGKISTPIEDLKQRQRTMSINECLKGTKDLKKLQAELIVAQTQNQERHAQMEPLQDQAATHHAIGGGEEEHGEDTGECTTMVQQEITMQNLEALTEKAAQVQIRGRELVDKFHSPTRLSRERAVPRWLRMSHMSVLGACWV
jgi:hypothetical protein